jgi:hypothetical protein
MRGITTLKTIKMEIRLHQGHNHAENRKADWYYNLGQSHTNKPQVAINKMNTCEHMYK